MKTKLIAITKPIIPGINSAEELIVYTARVSNPENQNKIETSSNLLKYCIKHNHWSIFEQADMTIEIETTRAISPQILRHKSFTFQEFSLRYSKSIGFEKTNPRKQDLKNRQNSTDDLDLFTKQWFNKKQSEIHKITEEVYNDAIGCGISKESARSLLPMSTRTRLYMKGSVRSWIHYLNVRCDKSTQLEHREIAESIKSIFIEQFPIISEALKWK